MLRCVNYGVTTIKPGHQTTGNMHVIWSDELFSMLFNTSQRVYVSRTPNEAYDLECLVRFQQSNMGEGSVMVWAAILWYTTLLVPLLSFMARLLQRNYVNRLGNQVPPMIQTLLLNNHAVFKDDNAPVHTTVWSWFKEYEGELQHLPCSAKSSDLNITEPLWSVLETRARKRCPSPTSVKQLKGVLQ
jgi:hypothetical protein